MKYLLKARSVLAVLLAGVLQVMPLMRAILPLEARGLAPSSWAWVLKLAGSATALFGSYHAVSGATQIVAPYTVNGAVGSPYSRQLTTSGQTAHSWSANTAPLGSAVFPLTPGLWLTNSNGRIGGVPTLAATSSITISAWENRGNSGASVSAVFLFTITNTGPPPPTPPAIITQPQSSTNLIGSSVTFNVGATGTAPLGYQWQLGGVSIAAATASSFTIGNVQPADAGTYSVVLSNAAGSVTSSGAVLTVIQPPADLATTISGPTRVSPGTNATFAVTVTNLGPGTATNVVVVDTFSPGVAFVSASGGGVFSGGAVTWPTLVSLPSGGAASFTFTVTAPTTGAFTNMVSATASTPDPNPANNNGSAPASQTVTVVLTAFGSQADLAVFQTGPTSVSPGSNLTYTIVVTNLGPSTASNVLVKDILPVNVSFVSAPGGTLSNSLVSWPPLPFLNSGTAASFSLTVTAPAAGAFTNIAFASSSTPDPNPANNDGTSPASQVTTLVATSQFAISSGGHVLNPQTGLVEEPVAVTNIGSATAAAVRLYVTGLRIGVQLYNATGTNAGKSYVLYDAPLNPSQTVTLRLEFWVPDRQPFTDSLQAEAVLPSVVTTRSGGGIAVSRTFVDARNPSAPRFAIEFSTVPGQVYTILYSDGNLAAWNVATPAITAGSTSTQWYDDGPPKTASLPFSTPSRFYFVVGPPTP